MYSNISGRTFYHECSKQIETMTMSSKQTKLDWLIHCNSIDSIRMPIGLCVGLFVCWSFSHQFCLLHNLCRKMSLKERAKKKNISDKVGHAAMHLTYCHMCSNKSVWIKWAQQECGVCVCVVTQPTIQCVSHNYIMINASGYSRTTCTFARGKWK